MVRRDGGQSCNVIWLLGDSEGDIVNGQTTFTFYIFIFGFLGPLGFILIFYVLVISIAFELSVVLGSHLEGELAICGVAVAGLLKSIEAEGKQDPMICLIKGGKF